jgi:hypothetical protein
MLNDFAPDDNFQSGLQTRETRENGNILAGTRRIQ